MEKDYISRYCKTISPEHQDRPYQVGEGYISRFYKTMSPEDQRGFIAGSPGTPLSDQS